MANLGLKYVGREQGWVNTEELFSDITFQNDKMYNVQIWNNHRFCSKPAGQQPNECEGFECRDAFGYVYKSGEVLWVRAVGCSLKVGINISD